LRIGEWRTGDRIAFVRNVKGVPSIYTLVVVRFVAAKPVFLTNGTEPDWQPTAPLPPTIPPSTIPPSTIPPSTIPPPALHPPAPRSGGDPGRLARRVN
jgi:hypothetical protein